MVRMTAALFVLLLLSGCAATQPKQTRNLCQIFVEKSGWYDDAIEVSKRWGSPIPVMMAIMHQESRFVSQAKPPRKWYLGFIPGPRPSAAYGYSQALPNTWRYYQQKTGHHGADRDDFADALDFIGWYNYISHQRNGIANDDTYHLYLAYHEGHGGFEKRSFRQKSRLKNVAKKVSHLSKTYHQQLNSCKDQLQSPWWWPF